jgi:hypothetical protein
MTFQKAECGIAVSAVWMVAVLGRRWRPLPSVIEWVSQALGYFWIAMIMVTFLLAVV